MTHENDDATDDLYRAAIGETYDYAYEHRGATVRVGVRRGGRTREPRVRWCVDDRCGERGYVDFGDAGPKLRLEGGETARVAGRRVSELPVPGELGAVLEDAREELGTVVAESARIEADPAAFPTAVGGFERAGWEAARNVMWYWRDGRSAPRAYQIERGELVFRAEEWIEGTDSKAELVEGYGLEAAF